MAISRLDQFHQMHAQCRSVDRILDRIQPIFDKGTETVVARKEILMKNRKKWKNVTTNWKNTGNTEQENRTLRAGTFLRTAHTTKGAILICIHTDNNHRQSEQSRRR